MNDKDAIKFFIYSYLLYFHRLDKALEQSSKLSDIVAKFDNNTRHLFFKNALSCIIIVLAMGDEVEAGKRLSNFAS